MSLWSSPNNRIMSTNLTPPKKKKNAASQYRSAGGGGGRGGRGSRRIAHPLLESISPPTTPVRKTTTSSSDEQETKANNNNNNMVVPVTPEHPGLLNALEMAARPSPSPIVPSSDKQDEQRRIRGNSNAKGNDTTAAPAAPAATKKSYSSSLEAMAAHVEASHNKKKRSTAKKGSINIISSTSSSSTSSSSVRSRRSLPLSSSLSTTPPKLKKRSSGSSLSSERSSSTIKSSNVRNTKKSRRPINKAWLIALPILLSFLVFESIIWLLVFRFKDGASANANAAASAAASDWSSVKSGVVMPTITQKTDANGIVVDVDTGVPVLSQEDAVAEKGRDMKEERGVVNDYTSEDSGDEVNIAVEDELKLGVTVASEEDAGETEIINTPKQTGAENEDAIMEEGSLSGSGSETKNEVDANTGELHRLQSMLDEGFEKLRLRGTNNNDNDMNKNNRNIPESKDDNEEYSQKKNVVESLCGNVWVAANAMLSAAAAAATAESQTNAKEEVTTTANANANAAAASASPGGDEITLGTFSEIETNPWRSLALGAQHCLGGAGLAFLSRDNVDSARLRVSTKVFDRLSYVEPYDPNVRAGLGTSLLIQGIFHNESEGSGEGEEAGDAQQSLLTLATYHLKVASSLFSTTTTTHQSSSVETTGGNDDNVAAVSNRDRANKAAVIDETTSASNAAILHNLALCYIAQGDNTNSVPILLKAAALRRESNVDANMYWNAPNDVLQLAEEKALLLAGKKKKKKSSSSQPEKVKKRRMPFFR